jgi:hypothetical protein
MPTDGASRPAKLEGAAELRERALVMLAAIERAEPRPLWDQLREVVTGATRVGDLRTVLRELRAMVGALSSDARRELARGQVATLVTPLLAAFMSALASKSYL